MAVARVLIMSKYADIEQPLDYAIPPGLSAPPGSVVRAPLGPRLVEGVVLVHPPEGQVPNLKEIRAVGPRRLSRELLGLAAWLAPRTGCSLAVALQAMLPPLGSGAPPKLWRLALPLPDSKLTAKQLLVVDYLKGQRPQSKAEIARALTISAAPINSLIAKQYLQPVAAAPTAPAWDLPPVTELTADQKRVLTAVEERSNGFTSGGEYLLHGVAGSGKTEVYIRLTRAVLAAGRQVLVLTPEIALTPQLVARYRAVFPQIAVFHSGLGSGRRAQEWDRIATGKAPIVIGTRSGVFAPLQRIGLIILDEEHELAYKQEEAPRYHARDVARFRARQHGALLVLGSATPALETYYSAVRGRPYLLTMPRPVQRGHSIQTEIIDMRQELARGNRHMLSEALTAALTATLAKKEQALLFLNRRGVAPTVLCRSCGYRYTCPNCSTSLTLHGQGLLRCHHCGATTRLAAACPNCGSKYLRELGAGTQKLEAFLAARYPEAHLSRVDRDTAGTARSKEQRLFDFYRQESGILLGTQMIAKGLDFPKITLVGVVLADLSLALPDFRAAERTFQLVAQAAGRAGRAFLPGRVIIQTYEPEHYSIRLATAGDYQGFYQAELAIREKAGLPPFSTLTRILVAAKERRLLQKKVEQITGLLSQEQFDLLYSGPPPLERIKGRWRWHFLLRHAGARVDWQRLAGLRRATTPAAQIRIAFDHNPHSFM